MNIGINNYIVVQISKYYRGITHQNDAVTDGKYKHCNIYMLWPIKPMNR